MCEYFKSKVAKLTFLALQMASIIAFCNCFSKLNDKQVIEKSLFGKLNWTLQLMDSENYIIVSFLAAEIN